MLNRFVSVGVLTVALLTAAASASAAEKYDIDSVHSTTIFRIKHLNVSWFYGRFVDIAGTINFDEKKPDASSFDVTIKTESVNTDNSARDKHLKNPDFFSAKQYPTMTFKSTSVKSAGKDALDVTGDLTCHGVTKQITVRMDIVGHGKDPFGGYRAGFETKFKIKRSDYGMDHMLEALGDDIELIVSLEGARK